MWPSSGGGRRWPIRWRPGGVANTETQRYPIWPQRHRVYPILATGLYIIYLVVLFQDLTLRSISGLPTVRGTAGIRYVIRRVFHSGMPQYFQVLYSGYTLSPRHNWPSVVLLIYSQYSLYYGLQYYSCLLYTSPSPRDQRGSRMPSSA